MTISSLPSEVIHYAISLSDPKTALAAATVNKRFYRLLDNKGFFWDMFKKMVLTTCENPPHEEIFKRICPTFQSFHPNKCWKMLTLAIADKTLRLRYFSFKEACPKIVSSLELQKAYCEKELNSIVKSKNCVELQKARKNLEVTQSKYYQLRAKLPLWRALNKHVFEFLLTKHSFDELLKIKVYFRAKIDDKIFKKNLRCWNTKEEIFNILQKPLAVEYLKYFETLKRLHVYSCSFTAFHAAQTAYSRICGRIDQLRKKSEELDKKLWFFKEPSRFDYALGINKQQDYLFLERDNFFDILNPSAAYLAIEAEYVHDLFQEFHELCPAEEDEWVTLAHLLSRE